MHDLNCPYCGQPQDVCHDDGNGYAEDQKHEMQYSECEKYFVFETTILYIYEPEKADCLNGEPHRLELVSHHPAYWPDCVRCTDCGYENMGKSIQETQKGQPHE